MVFSSAEFLFLFLPAFLLLYWILPGALRNALILLFSWGFYAWWRLDYLPLLIIVTLWAWAFGLLLGDAQRAHRRAIVSIAVAGVLGLLGWFKYANLVANTVRAFAHGIPPWHEIALPIGLSFFVFGAISYLVDVYRGTVAAERNVVTYGAYQAIFPHLVAGPIIRYASIADGLHHREFTWDGCVAGAQRFMLAFAAKILLADTLAPLVDAGFRLAHPSFADALLATVGYALQLYFDFSAYSGMAIGLGLMMGLRFPENFNLPYVSLSVTEFWRRWHITLSSWLRDYLYIPLGGNRSGEARTYLNLMITMALGGLWHGASWTFMLWGIWHGAGLVVERFWKAAQWPQPPAFVKRVATSAFVLVGWTLFRSVDWTTAAQMFSGIAGVNGFALSASFRADLRPMETLALALGLAIIYWPLVQRHSERLEGAGIVAVRRGAFVLFALSCWALQGRATVPFLYFQF